MELVKIDQAELAESLKSVDNPEIKEWVWKAWRKGKLELIVQGLMEAEQVKVISDAIDYLLKYIAVEIQYLIRNKTALGHFQNTSRVSAAERELEELINGKNPKYYDRTRYYGIKGHVVIPKLFSGELIQPSYYLTHLRTEKSWKEFAILYREEMGIIEDKPPLSSLALLAKKAVRASLKRNHPVTKKTRRAQDLVWKVEDCLVKISIEMETDKYPRYSRHYVKLVQHLKKIFGEPIKEMLDRLFDDDYLTFLTCLTWGRAVTFYSHFARPLISFDEVSVFDFDYDIGAGRIDSLVVHRINGKVPNRVQTTIIKMVKARLSTASHRPSVGQIIRELVIQLGGKIEFRIYDWKFAVGDGPSGMRKKQLVNIIASSIVQKEPLYEHIRQMKRYIAVAYLSWAVATGKDVEHEYNIERIYDDAPFEVGGTLLYFTPDESPMPYSFYVEKAEMIRTVEDQLFSNFKKAYKRSKRHQITKHVVKHTLSLIKEEPIVSKTALRNAGHQYSLFGPQSSFSAFAAIYTQPVFKDSLNIIELVGKDKTGRDMHEMHLNTLLAAMEDGRVIAAPNFNMVSGGFVSCMVVPENTPSLSLSFQKHYFKCFSCGVSGTFAELSITDEMREMIATMPSFKRHRETERLIIPPRHREIMVAAQVLLQAAFKGSDGQRYLEGTRKGDRGLDAEQSFMTGVGYGTHDLIIGLLDQGFTYDELIYYGFIGLSPKLSQDDQLSLALLRWGLTVEEIGVLQKKQLKPGQPAEIVPCFPYSVLERRITYPLEISGVIDSFYGRSVDIYSEKSAYHRKLPNGAHQLPHGAYNMAQAMFDATENNSPILVTEAPIDANTFMQISDIKYVTGIVGVSNHLLLELLSDFQGDIIIALDWDKKDPDNPEKGETGQKNTVKAATLLREYGFRGKIYDFTKLFVEQNPNVEYKDANRYWLDYKQRISIMDLIKGAPSL